MVSNLNGKPLRYSNRKFKAELERIEDGKGRLSISYRGNGHSSVLEHSHSILEDAFTGEFQRPKAWKNSALGRVEKKYSRRVGEGRFQRNLAYIAVRDHPLHSKHRFSSGFTPIREEDLGDVLNFGTERRPLLSREDERRLFISLDYHKINIHRRTREIFRDPEGEHGEGVSNLMSHYNDSNSLRDLVIDANFRLVFSRMRWWVINRKALKKAEGFEMKNLGFLALHNAVDLFDPYRGIKFSTYAFHAINKTFSRYVKAEAKRRPLSLDPFSLGQHENRKSRYTIENLEDNTSLDSSKIKKIMDGNLAALTEREFYILGARFYSREKEKTLEEIGSILGVCKERARQIQNIALKKVKFAFSEE